MLRNEADLASYRALSRHDRYMLIRDHRDEFASADDDALADAPLNDELIIAIMIESFARMIDLRSDHDASCIADLHAMMNALIDDDFAIINAIESIDLDASHEAAIETIAFNMITRCFMITDPDEMIDLIDDLHATITFQ